MKSEKLNWLFKDIRNSLQSIYGERLKEVLLFGSYARREATPLSDIDFLVVLDAFTKVGQEIEYMSAFSSALSLKYDVTISVVPIREKDFKEKRSPFLKNIAGESIAI